MIKTCQIIHTGGLTLREEEVLSLLREGATQKAIAGILSVSLATIKFDMRIITAKLGARNATHAVVVAIRKGLLSLVDVGI